MNTMFINRVWHLVSPHRWPLTHWGRVTHICVGKLTITGSDNGLSPGRRQDIIWTNTGILLIGPLGTNFSEMLIGIQTFSFKKMPSKMSSAKWRPFCLNLNVLIHKILWFHLPVMVINCYHSYQRASEDINLYWIPGYWETGSDVSTSVTGEQRNELHPDPNKWTASI